MFSVPFLFRDTPAPGDNSSLVLPYLEDTVMASAVLARAQTRQRVQLIAMRDAAIGTLQAARHQFQQLQVLTEQVSLQYVYGNMDRDEVSAVTQKFMEARQSLETATRRLQICQEALQDFEQRTASVAVPV